MIFAGALSHVLLATSHAASGLQRREAPRNQTLESLTSIFYLGQNTSFENTIPDCYPHKEGDRFNGGVPCSDIVELDKVLEERNSKIVDSIKSDDPQVKENIQFLTAICDSLSESNVLEATSSCAKDMCNSKDQKEVEEQYKKAIDYVKKNCKKVMEDYKAIVEEGYTYYNDDGKETKVKASTFPEEAQKVIDKFGGKGSSAPWSGLNAGTSIMGLGLLAFAFYTVV